MMNPLWKLFFLMPDGGDGAGGADGGEGAGVSDQDAADQTGRDAEVSAQEQNAQNPTVPDEKARRAAFEKLIREEYPDLYKEKTQKTIQNRLRGAKAAEEQLGKLAPALQLLQKQYGTDDLDALTAAITDDERFYEDEAQRRGIDTQTFKLLQQKEQQLNAMRAMQQEAEQRQEQANKVMRWRGEEAELRGMYPGFSLDAEMEENPEFFQLLDSGISVRHAYEVMHMDEIMGNTIAGAVQRTAQRTVDTIRTNGLRPEENGAGKAAGKPVRFDVNKLTDAQMRDIEKRVARGETVTPDKF